MTSNTPETQSILPVTADEDRCDICCRPREQHVGRDLQCDTTTYFRPMPPQSHSLPGDVGMQEPWPGCYADLHERRVTTLAKLGLMLSVMASGEAAEVVGYDAADLYAEVLMALAIEDADDTDLALEELRDHPDCDIMPMQVRYEALAYLSTPTAEPMEMLVDQAWLDRRQAEPDANVEGGAPIRQHVMPGDPAHLLQTTLQWYLKFDFGYPHSVRESNIAAEAFKDGYRAAITTPPTPDRIGKDAVREALKPFADKASMCDFGSDDYCPDWSPFIPVGAYRNAARALSATPAQPVDETERLRRALDGVDCISRLRDELGGKIEMTWLDPKQSWPMFNLLSEINSGPAALQHKGEVSRG